GSASEAAAGPRPKRKISTKQIASFVFGMVIVVGIFVFAIPRFADYGEVWAAVKTLTPLEFWSLFAAMVFNLFTYWIANMAAHRGGRAPHARVQERGDGSASGRADRPGRERCVAPVPARSGRRDGRPVGQVPARDDHPRAPAVAPVDVGDAPQPPRALLRAAA